MATRPYFLIADDSSIFTEKFCEFKFYKGFALSQKQKSIDSLHNEIQKYERDKKILEVSRKSKNPIGEQLSTIDLKNTDIYAKMLHEPDNILKGAMFYDYLYVYFFDKVPQIVHEMSKYDIFTDIEYNPINSMHCIARPVAIFASLHRKGLVSKYLNNRQMFVTIYQNRTKEQLKLF